MAANGHVTQLLGWWAVLNEDYSPACTPPFYLPPLPPLHYPLSTTPSPLPGHKSGYKARPRRTSRPVACCIRHPQHRVAVPFLDHLRAETADMGEALVQLGREIAADGAALREKGDTPTPTHAGKEVFWKAPRREPIEIWRATLSRRKQASLAMLGASLHRLIAHCSLLVTTTQSLPPPPDCAPSSC